MYHPTENYPYFNSKRGKKEARRERIWYLWYRYATMSYRMLFVCCGCGNVPSSSSRVSVVRVMSHPCKNRNASTSCNDVTGAFERRHLVCQQKREACRHHIILLFHLCFHWYHHTIMDVRYHTSHQYHTTSIGQLLPVPYRQIKITFKDKPCRR